MEFAIIFESAQKNGYVEEFVNACLVAYGGRPAMLLQEADYEQGKDEVNIILRLISKAFPELYVHDMYQGIIVSKNSISLDVNNSVATGHILGYIEPMDIMLADREYDMQINVFTNDGKKYNIYGMVASKIWKDEANAQAVKFMDAFKMSPLKDYILHTEAVFTKIYREVDIIYALIDNTINDTTSNHIRNYLWNLGVYQLPNVYEQKWEEYPYDFKNPFQRGILIGLLAMIEAFSYSLFDNEKMTQFHNTIVNFLNDESYQKKTMRYGFNNILDTLFAINPYNETDVNENKNEMMYYSDELEN